MHYNKIIVSLLLQGIFVTVFSCKIHRKEQVEEAAPVDHLIHLSDAQIHLANINTAEASETTIGQQLTLTGTLKVNEQSAVTISSRVPGRVEKLYFRNTGETVNKGDLLYEFYSEELVNAQREYFRLQANNWNFTGKYEPSLILEDKLLVMGMLPSQIKQLAKDGKILFRIPIFSPAAGTIRSIKVSEGQYIDEGQPLYELADDRNLWLEAQVYPDEIRYLKPGMPAIATVPIAGGLSLKCTINFINPSFEQGKNVTLVRAIIDNHEKRLFPGMLVLLHLQTQTSQGIIIPASAVISGAEHNYVWVREESGVFSRRTVTAGLQSGDSVLVLSGLVPSDQIVTSGAYLLNSELILRQGESLTAEEESTDYVINEEITDEADH